jgi:hypothetical protein
MTRAMITGRKLTKKKNLVFRAAFPKEKKTEKTSPMELRKYRNVLAFFSAILFLLSYQIIKNSLKVIIWRCDLLDFNLEIDKKRREEGKKFISVSCLYKKRILLRVKMNTQDIIFMDEF